MLQDVIHPPPPPDHDQQQLSIEGIPSPIADEILVDFCDDNDLFMETLRTSSDVCSTSATAGITAAAAGCSSDGGGLCCYDDAAFAATLEPFDSAALSALLDPQQPSGPDPGVVPTAPATFPSSPPAMSAAPPAPYIMDHHHNNFDDHIILPDSISNGYPSYNLPDPMGPIQVGPTHQQLPSVYEECLPPLPPPPQPAMVPGYIGMDAGGFYPGSIGNGPACIGDGRLGFFPGGLMLGQELEGVDAYSPDSMQRAYSAGDLQLMADRQHLVGGCCSSTTTLPASSDIPALDESTFKVGRLSAEERKEKIHRYMKKRNERNFSKKIKYACRKTLADSRPRVRGRFAKNDEFGEATTRPSSNHHDYDEYEDVSVKEEDDIINSSDILAHISGVNSFKYNYTLESWI